MKNDIKFKEYMTLLGEIHGKEITLALKDLYWKMLKPFSDEQCERAFEALIMSARFFPKPVDFIEQICGKQGDQGTAAWVTVIKAVSRVGNYRSVRFTDPVIHGVIEVMGGWPEFCMMQADDVKWKQKEFERLYQVMQANGGKFPDHLPGTHELENFKNGFGSDHPDIALIEYDGYAEEGPEMITSEMEIRP